MREKCPECDQLLKKNCNECYCGWDSSQSQQAQERDHQCAYTVSGLRCPLDGTNNFSTHGGGSWYCLDHYQNLDNREKCHEILMNAFRDFVEIMESRIDWRIRLFPEEYAAKKQQIQRLFQSLKKP